MGRHIVLCALAAASMASTILFPGASLAADLSLAEPTQTLSNNGAPSGCTIDFHIIHPEGSRGGRHVGLSGGVAILMHGQTFRAVVRLGVADNPTVQPVRHVAPGTVLIRQGAQTNAADVATSWTDESGFLNTAYTMPGQQTAHALSTLATTGRLQLSYARQGAQRQEPFELDIAARANGARDASSVARWGACQGLLVAAALNAQRGQHAR